MCVEWNEQMREALDLDSVSGPELQRLIPTLSLRYNSLIVYENREED